MECKRLTIFEGPDGSGKSTAALKFAKDTGARYVHFPALSRVGKNLSRMYVEAMMPALLGYQDVVFDRCWLSELPYGTVFRDGQDRIGDPSRRMLERLAMRCSAVVVLCLTTWESTSKTFLSRKGSEMLDSLGQLESVRNMYISTRSGLPEVLYNYEDGHEICKLVSDMRSMRTHPVNMVSAGNMDSMVVLVGDSNSDVEDVDSFYRWPFASFSNRGCSQWLTQTLESARILESSLLWVSSNQPHVHLKEIKRNSKPRKIIALGHNASGWLVEAGVDHEFVEHPDYHKRFNPHMKYNLIDQIRSVS